MNGSEDWEAHLWTDRTRQEYLDQGENAIEVLREHLRLVAACSSDDDEPHIDASAERVREAFVALSDAEFNYSSTLAPFAALDDDTHPDADDEKPLDEMAEHNQVTVMARRDFRITSEAAIIMAGREAYLETWPEDTAEAAVDDVADLGRALYQIVHARGLDALSDLEGIDPTVDLTLALGVDELLGPEDLEDPLDNTDELFAAEGEVLFLNAGFWE